MQKMKRSIIVDADSCPVKEEIILIAKEHNAEVFFVSSYSHQVEDSRITKSIIVDNVKEAADMYIINHVQKDDIVITQDHALASLLLPRGAEVISPRGIQYSEENMLTMLETRHLSQKQRRAGFKTKGPKKFIEQDRINFCHNLRRILEKKAGK